MLSLIYNESLCGQLRMQFSLFALFSIWYQSKNVEILKLTQLFVIKKYRDDKAGQSLLTVSTCHQPT